MKSRCLNRILRGIRRNFFRLSPCNGQVAYVLLTRAPVADKCIATSSLPLDLHVLSLSLAFILSQDQTLRCLSYSYLFSKIKTDYLLFIICRSITELILTEIEFAWLEIDRDVIYLCRYPFSCTTSSYCNFFNVLVAFFCYSIFSSRKLCKGTPNF